MPCHYFIVCHQETRDPVDICRRTYAYKWSTFKNIHVVLLAYPLQDGAKQWLRCKFRSLYFSFKSSQIVIFTTGERSCEGQDSSEYIISSHYAVRLGELLVSNWVQMADRDCRGKSLKCHFLLRKRCQGGTSQRPSSHAPRSKEFFGRWCY